MANDDQRKQVHVGSGWRLILRDLGLDERAILRRAGQPPTLLEGEGSHISVDAFYGLHEAIEAEGVDSSIALKAGSVLSIELFDPALFVAICSPNLNVAATRLGQFKRLVGAFSLDVDIGPGSTLARYRCKHRPDLPMLLGLTEMVFLVAFARRATRHEIVPRRVTLQRLPEPLDPYLAYFGCRIDEAEAFTVEFGVDDAARPFLTHNARMWEAFEPGLRRRQAEANELRPIREQVELALFELLPSGRARSRMWPKSSASAPARSSVDWPPRTRAGSRSSTRRANGSLATICGPRG